MKGLKKNIDKSRNFNFQNLIFSHFVRLNIAIKRIPHISPWLCAWDVCYIIFCHLLHIHSGKYRDFVFITIAQFMMGSNIIRLFVHKTISLSSLCKLIWRQWTYKMPVRYILSSVWVRLSIFSQLSIIQYMGLCVCSLPISLTVMIEMIYTLYYYHHQIGSMNYYPLFRARSWNNGMRCMSIFLLYYFWDSQHHCCNISIFSSIKNNYIK